MKPSHSPIRVSLGTRLHCSWQSHHFFVLRFRTPAAALPAGTCL